MKNRFAVAALLLAALSVPVHAQFQGPSASVTEATVAQVRSGLRVGSDVTLTGHVVEHQREDYFTFRDDSGSIRVEISPRVFGGRTVTPEDRVRITGEIDRSPRGRYIDVESLEILH